MMDIEAFKAEVQAHLEKPENADMREYAEMMLAQIEAFRIQAAGLGIALAIAGLQANDYRYPKDWTNLVEDDTCL